MNHREFTKTFVTELETERTRLGYSQAQMAKALGLSLSTYKNMINGTTEKIDAYIAYSFYQMLDGHITDAMLQLMPTTNRIVAKLGAMNEQQLRYIEAIVDFENNFQLHSNGNDYVTALIPTGCMEDGMLWDSFDAEKVDVSKYRPRIGDSVDIAVKVTSNHLAPVYVQGDILLIDRRPPKDGETLIAINKENGRAYLRRFVRANPCRLEPVNGFGATFTVDPYDRKQVLNWIKFGVVVTHIRG